MWKKENIPSHSAKLTIAHLAKKKKTANLWKIFQPLQIITQLEICGQSLKEVHVRINSFYTTENFTNINWCTYKFYSTNIDLHNRNWESIHLSSTIVYLCAIHYSVSVCGPPQCVPVHSLPQYVSVRPTTVCLCAWNTTMCLCVQTITVCLCAHLLTVCLCVQSTTACLCVRPTSVSLNLVYHSLAEKYSHNL